VPETEYGQISLRQKPRTAIDRREIALTRYRRGVRYRSRRVNNELRALRTKRPNDWYRFRKKVVSSNRVRRIKAL